MTRVNISELAKAQGVDRLRFFIPVRPLHSYFGIIHCTSSSDEPVIKECVADETRYNRKVTEGYKIILRPLDPTFAYEEFYQTDLQNLIYRHPDLFRIAVVFNNEDVQ